MPAEANRPTVNRPNLVVIMADELRRDALECYGDPNVHTPHINALAARGVRFAAACSTYPICVPARFTFMTGQSAHSRMVPGIGWRMSPAEVTLADEFNDAGYETIYVGKWHLYGDHIPFHLNGQVDWATTSLRCFRTPIPRQHQGRWHKWLGFELRNGPYDTYYFEDDDPTPRKIDKYQTDGLFDLALREIGRAAAPGPAAAPFCCVISVEPPHFPLIGPREAKPRWRGRPLTMPPSFGFVPDDPVFPHGQAMDAARREAMLDEWREYYAMIENLDDNVGALAAFLRDRGLADNTVVVLLSDHGETGGCHGLPMGSKLFPYEDSVGIPLIVADPTSRLAPDSVLQDPTNMEDVFPTLLGLAGLSPRVPRASRESLPGTDLSPLIRGQAAALPREGVMLEFVHDSLYSSHESFNRNMWRGVRTRRDKYTVIGPSRGGVPWQLFDLTADPHELNNLIRDPASQAVAADLHRLLRAELVRTGDDYVLQPAFGLPGLNLYHPDDTASPSPQGT